MITRSVTIEPMDALDLAWHDHINASALYRHALREELMVRGINPDDPCDLLNRTQEQGYTLEEIAADTDRFDDLQSLVADDSNPVRVDDPSP